MTLADLDIVGLALWMVAFLLSTTCHEAGHALAGLWGGDSTAYRAGQVTLNPWPHIRREPFGMVFVPLISFAWQGFMIGWASAPYDPRWAGRHPRRAGLMAAAGPAANLLLLLLAIGAIRLMVATGVGSAPEMVRMDTLVRIASADPLMTALARFLSILTMLNGLLLFFNLIPVPPLDGAAIIEGLVGGGPARMMRLFRTLPMAGLLGIIIAWQLFDFFAPWIFGGILAALYPGVGYS
ncbi:MAG: site-2 protease family protein [Acidobacteriota bacterium]|nr:site-2 protease family protein [Acidobacteriota bacterium]MDQ7087313.1 site-2 protease family protein [Acidobacteriota bacterium]